MKALNFIWESESIEKAQKNAKKGIEFYEDRLPKAADKIEDTLNVLTLPKKHRRRMKSTNMLERLSGSISQRTKVVRIFPELFPTKKALCD